MENRFLEADPINLETVKKELKEWLQSYPGKLDKVLIIPPDATRAHSLAGPITNILYHLLQPAEIKILPALGTHVPMTAKEKDRLFGADIPKNIYMDHLWRTDVEQLGTVPGEFVSKISNGLLDYSIRVDINREILQGNYDLIISVGQIVPHEVSGMANYTKNIVVGCGDKEIIDKSHFLGAVYGMERMMGRADTPVRRVFDYSEEHFLKDLPITYILTVTKTEERETSLQGLFLGRGEKVFARAVAASQKHNLDLLEKPLDKVVVYLDPHAFKSTWLGNKAIYRTRMAIADEGELLIIAPGVRSFGEDSEIDKLIRVYGYQDRDKILQYVETDEELARNLSAAAHLIHGSSDGRFKITYSTEYLTESDIRGVNYDYLSLSEAYKLYDLDQLHDGYNVVNGEKIFYVSNPALGLWALAKEFSPSH